MTKLTPRVQYLKDNLRAKGWRDFLYHTAYHTSPGSSTAIFATIPPTYIRTNDDSWEYLRQIAAGHVNIPGCGTVCRDELAQFLRENDPENQKGDIMLKPCPFCGGNVTYTQNHITREHHIECLECAALTLFNVDLLKEDVIAHWNTRTPIQASPNHPVIPDPNGVPRYQAKPLTEWLCDQIDLNTMWRAYKQNQFPRNEFMQFYREIGYTLTGFDEVWDKMPDEIEMETQDNPAESTQ